MSRCHCGLASAFDQCCAPILAQVHTAQSAEALMRAIYSAHASGQLGFLAHAYHPTVRHELDLEQASRWASQSEWLGFELVSVSDQPEHDLPTQAVEFIAHFRDKKGVRQTHHEVAVCEQLDGQWYFKQNEIPKLAAVATDKVGRNDPCPCGNGKKYKKCCGLAA